ncbi:hypothetical protein EYF80_007741 [Liparis tanakae]|uniref:Uncharacterized protein n=1 Tax=Liparis tanakae TaxID=230148 RepID=A0A4Z2IVV6_9TELE|nr:hypothetical protein EYF80_007741 [Liparis tanakae]
MEFNFNTGVIISRRLEVPAAPAAPPSDRNTGGHKREKISPMPPFQPGGAVGFPSNEIFFWMEASTRRQFPDSAMVIVRHSSFSRSTSPGGTGREEEEVRGNGRGARYHSRDDLMNMKHPPAAG